jgi:hypothetical protein
MLLLAVNLPAREQPSPVGHPLRKPNISVILPEYNQPVAIIPLFSIRKPGSGSSPI